MLRGAVEPLTSPAGLELRAQRARELFSSLETRPATRLTGTLDLKPPRPVSSGLAQTSPVLLLRNK